MKRVTKVTVLIIISVGLILAALEFTNTTHFFHKQKINHGSGSIPSKATSPSVISSSKAKSNDATSNKSGQPAGSTELVVPFGTFVSNHSPNLGGSPHPSQEESVCNTTPGATCYIQFTNGDIVKRLDSQTVNSSGAVIWNWDVNKAGFGVGTWKITAIASLNGQTQTATDPINLEMKP